MSITAMWAAVSAIEIARLSSLITMQRTDAVMHGAPLVIVQVEEEIATHRQALVEYAAELGISSPTDLAGAT